MNSSFIDHTLLKPVTSMEQIEALCKEAIDHNFFSVCVNPCWVEFAAKLLINQTPLVCTVVGFPLGAALIEVKAFETKMAIQKGADEIDMVMNIGAFKSGDERWVEQDINAVVEAAAGKTVKVILETCLLTDDEIVRACQIALEAKAHFVKTSTGFASGGATVEAVKLMRQIVGYRMGVKASGGIRTIDDAKKMIEAGASRLGTSSGVKIVQTI